HTAAMATGRIWKTWHRRTRPQSNWSGASTPRAAPASAKNPGRASPRGPCPGLRRSEPPAQAGDPVGVARLAMFRGPVAAGIAEAALVDHAEVGREPRRGRPAQPHPGLGGGQAGTDATAHIVPAVQLKFQLGL